MAQLKFSETALLHIRAVLATQPIIEPVLAVGWWKGQFESSRGEDGAAVWKQVEPARWYAHISDWNEFPKTDGAATLLEEMHGFSVYRDERVKAEPGTLHVFLTEVGLAVERGAA
jgi:hypothetical protein